MKELEIYYSSYLYWRKRVGKSQNTFDQLLIYWIIQVSRNNVRVYKVQFLICLFKLLSITPSCSKRRCQVRRFQVSGTRCAGSRCQAPGSRFQVRRCQVPDSRFQVSGARDHVAMDHVSGFGDKVPCQNVKNFHIKNILRLNGNYKLILCLNGNYKLTNTFFTKLVFSLCNFLNSL